MTDLTSTPLLLKAARGEVVSRPPAWMMRQAGRYMKVYQDLSKKYPGFRERSENPDLAIEISLQPWSAFQPDGVIMFSDILTPLPGIGIDFDISESQGPVFQETIRTAQQVNNLHDLDPESSLPFIKTILQSLRNEVADKSTVLGFVGAPWTLATYAIEGKTSKTYSIIKQMAFSDPTILHQLLSKIADAIAVYARYQIDCGAQVIQLFDSWAGQLCPQDYETFALPYQQQVVRQVKETHPDTPLILYINGSAGILKQMSQSGVDIISLDWTVDMAEARQLLGQEQKVQGNIDPGVLFGSQDLIRDRIFKTIEKAGNTGHILNLGHGVLVGTPEENVGFFFDTVRQISLS